MSLGRAMLLARQTFQRGLAASYHLHRTAPRIWDDYHCNDLVSEKTVHIHVLTGEENATMTAWMLASLEHATERSWEVVVHDDGSLTEPTIQRLQKLFPRLRVVSVEEAAERVESALEPFPRCAEYRARHALSRKCFDVPLLCEADRFLLLDSDVLFYRRPSRILQWVDDPEDDRCWFNADFQEPSPILPEEAVSMFGHPLWPKVNSGICLLQRKAIRLEDHERYLKCDRLREGNPWRIEQTLLALSASKTERGGLLPSTYEVSQRRHRRGNCIARHYVGEVRARFYGEGVADLRRVLLD